MSQPEPNTPPTSARRSDHAELNPDMEKVELHAFGLRAMLDTAREELGAAAVDEILRSFGVSWARLTGKDAWASMSFVEGFMSEMVARSGDERIVDRFSEASITPKYLGVIYPLVRAFGNPGLVYDQVVKTAPRFNKVGIYTTLEQRSGFVRLDYRPTPEARRDSTPWFCRSRLVQLSCIPKLFGLPAARYEHPRCMVRGDESCVYELKWQVPPRQGLVWIGIGVGLIVGAAVAWLGAAETALSLYLLAISALVGGIVSRIIQLTETNELRVAELSEHHAALEQSVRQNEERLSELLAAKAAVESRVQARTRELKETGDKLAETLHQVQALDRAKTDFFNNVSHELRTPLTLILGPLSEMISGRTPPGGSKVALETIQRNATRLLQLINQLLDLAKVDAGKVTLAREPVELVDFARELTRVFESSALSRGIRLSFDGAGPIPMQLDTRWFDSALTNLIANALRFAPSDGWVAVRVLDRGSDVVIEVEDNGPGMSAADAERVFERFAQASDVRATRGGTGLGLPIVREAARLHGGDVGVRSELGKGSTFSLVLPRTLEANIQQPPPAREAVESSGKANTPVPSARAPRPEPELQPWSESEVAGPPDRPLVLVVEDNPDLGAYIAHVLAASFRIRLARNGVEALAMAATHPPELIVSDIAMPEMDGYELCRRVRDDRTLTGTPLLLLTARSDTVAVMTGFDAGASDYIVKPFHARELVARVSVHVQRRRLLRDTTAHGRLAMLGQIAASIAHQTRNPLTSLISGLPAIRSRLKDTLDARTLELLDVMIDCAERIERLTRDLMDVSRVDREQEADFAPGRSLLACARLASPRIHGGEIELRQDVDVDTSLRGRPGDLHHVLLNVLDNAVRAIEGSGAIELRGYVADDIYVMEIGDSGSGVPPEIRDSIFEPFWTSRPAGQGTGLGLAIALQLVREHGGTITVGNSPLGGALFQIRLPLVRAAVRAQSDAA